MARLSWILLLVAAVRVESWGTPANIERFPSAAQVEFGYGGLWIQQCTGAIITNYHILSSASCFSGTWYDRDNRRFRVGATYRDISGDVVYVQHAYNHPYFGSLGRDGDLSVVRLYDSLVFSDSIRMVSIIGQGIELPLGLPVTNVGWGTTAQGGEISTHQLHEINLFTHDYERCMEYYLAIDEPEIITENMICVGRSFNTGRDFDVNDVGAPLYYSGALVGILSFGKSYSGDSHPLVATNIGYFSDWIVATARY